VTFASTIPAAIPSAVPVPAAVAVAVSVARAVPASAAVSVPSAVAIAAAAAIAVARRAHIPDNRRQGSGNLGATCVQSVRQRPHAGDGSKCDQGHKQSKLHSGLCRVLLNHFSAKSLETLATAHKSPFPLRVRAGLPTNWTAADARPITTRSAKV
jgi:hypothetical protein